MLVLCTYHSILLNIENNQLIYVNLYNINIKKKKLEYYLIFNLSEDKIHSSFPIKNNMIKSILLSHNIKSLHSLLAMNLFNRTT